MKIKQVMSVAEQERNRLVSSKLELLSVEAVGPLVTLVIVWIIATRI